MMNEMVSMQDIADAVGVSKATVSLVLNGNAGSRVSEKVRHKVINAANEMGYQINDLARSLRTGRTNFISVLVTDISNDFFGKMSFYIQEEAKKHGYLVITANTNESDEELKSMVSVMAGKKVDGIIAVPTHDCKDALSSAISRGIPVVQIDRYIDGLDAPYVGTDNYNSTRHAIEELIGNGKKNIAMITLDLGVNAITERRNGYEDTLKAHGCFHPELIKAIEFDDIDRVKTAIGELMALSPDAVFFSSRRVFTLALEILTTYDVSIYPMSDVTFLCFDEAKPYKSLLRQNLWYIRQPVEEMAKEAFNLLLKTMDKKPTSIRYEFESTLVK